MLCLLCSFRGVNVFGFILYPHLVFRHCKISCSYFTVYIFSQADKCGFNLPLIFFSKMENCHGAHYFFLRGFLNFESKRHTHRRECIEIQSHVLTPYFTTVGSFRVQQGKNNRGHFGVNNEIKSGSFRGRDYFRVDSGIMLRMGFISGWRL